MCDLFIKKSPNLQRFCHLEAITILAENICNFHSPNDCDKMNSRSVICNHKSKKVD